MAKANCYSIELKNCRNISSIDGGSIRIVRNHLNVFYGKNGTGKTTLCRAIRYAAGEESYPLATLESFDYRESGDPGLLPVVNATGRIKNLLVFDDKWIQDHCFVASTIHKDAFELYVRDEAVRKLEKKRRDKIGWLKSVLGRAEVLEMQSVLQDLLKSLGRTKNNGGFAASAPIAKAFKAGSPIEPVPSFLRPVLKGYTGVEKAAWLQWHKGRPTTADERLCPYCGIEDEARLRQCQDYDESHSGTAVAQWEKIARAYENYSHCLSRGNAALLRRVVGNRKAPDKSQLQALASFSENVKRASDAIEAIGNSLDKESNIDAVQLINELKAESAKLDSCTLFLKTKNGMLTSQGKALKWIHDSIDRLVKTQTELDTICAALVAQVRANISGHEKEINAFLEECGYRYKIEIECSIPSSDAKILLKPSVCSVEITEPMETLSYGEQNALALMLFMHEAVKKPNGVYILDDPISSFDFDKRFGVLYALFSSKSTLFNSNLCGKTVIVMTHDPLVLSDLIGIQMPGVKASGVNGSYLSVDKTGQLVCTALDGQALVPYTQLLYKEIQRCRERPRIFGYVRIRQYCELLRHDTEERKTRYAWTFSLLSDLIHGRNRQETLDYHGWSVPDNRKVAMCENLIKSLTGWDLDYWAEIDFYSDCMDHLLELYSDRGLASEDKLLLVRLMLERDHTLLDGSSIMKRFADEACHMGGSYLRQLDGKKYDQVPFYVIEWCDRIAAKVQERLNAQGMPAVC